MRVRHVATTATIALIFGLVIGATGVQAQTGAPASLVVPLGDLFLTPEADLSTAPPSTTGACAPMLQPGTANAAKSWNFVLPFNAEAPAGNTSGGGNLSLGIGFDDQGGMAGPSGGGMWHLVNPVTLDLTWTGAAGAGGGLPTAPPAAAAPPDGITVTGRLEGSENPLTATVTIPPGPVNSGTQLTFTPNATAPLTGHGVPLKLTVELGGNGNLAVNCGTSKLGGAQVIRGMPGDGDIDGDSIPNREDLDRDGDSVANTAEPGSCAYGTPALGPYADNSGIATGKDSDGDGYNDEVECAAAANPQSRASIPAQPKTIMEILMPWILLLIVLLIIAAIIFVFLKYGKTAAVTIVSQAELFIPPGTKGKYEVAVQNLSKKGEPRTYQLSVAGMPEGWDAKLTVDHVTLDPQGGAANRQTLWLEVEAPAHNEAESAVVTIKATPLNKAGRKDTFKLPGKAETITSINVPPGSAVPVKRGGAIKAAEPKKEKATAEPPGDTRPAKDIEGIGDTYAAKLEKMGILTVGDLMKADPAVVAKKTGAAPGSVASWQQMAELMQLEGIGPQFSEQLVRTGVTSIAMLAKEDPKELVAKIEKTNAARETPIQGAGIQEKQAKNFVKAAQKWEKAQTKAAEKTEGAAAPAAAAAAAAPAAAAAAAPAAGAPAKPQLQVGGLKHEPPAFRQGDAVKSTVNVANNGKDKSTIKLSLYVNDGLADVQTVTVKAGKAHDVQFKWTAQEKNKLNIRGEIVPG